ncbi:MAG: 50S ribosomal protein L25 [bacterium]|nr:50S ribosomal protein L25 [bacterium]
MLILKAKIRSVEAKTDEIRKQGRLPAVLYGPGIKENFNIEVDAKEFLKVFQETGRTSFLQLELEMKESKPKPFLVMVKDLQKDPIKLLISHIDFYQPAIDKEIKVMVPLVFVGESDAVKNLAGNLLKNILEVPVQALPQKLPHQIEVDLSSLDELGKTILIKDLNMPADTKILKHPEEIVAQVTEQEKIEEELAKPVEEKIEEVEKVEKEKKEEEVPEEETKTGTAIPSKATPKEK